jgi:tRNA modification GTPase
MNVDTIAALATPPGIGGISIIKVSGPQAIAIAKIVFRPAAARPPAGLPPAFDSHRLYYGHVTDPASGRVIDEVLLGVMKAPRSYTREDVVEINAHGGPVAAREVLRTVLEQGARLAEPGEFTRRAFMNGRIDLTQAEAVVDLIQARTSRFLLSAAAQAGGWLKAEIEKIRQAAVDLLAELNAGIDFPEEVEAPGSDADLRCRVDADLAAPLRRLLLNCTEGRVLREGLAVAIVGRPNVGKSSLLNRLLGRDRAIVTPHPGTTRDVVEDCLNLDGVPVLLADTAGIHDSPDPVEAIGMQRTLEAVRNADLVLFVLEAHRPVSEGDRALFAGIGAKPVMFVLNKADLVAASGAAARVPEDWPRGRSCLVSALTGEGVEALRRAIARSAGGEDGLPSAGAVIPNLRQKLLLESCLEAADSAVKALEPGLGHEIAAIHLSDIVTGCGEVLGTHAGVDLLEHIFSRFCIGK